MQSWDSHYSGDMYPATSWFCKCRLPYYQLPQLECWTQLDMIRARYNAGYYSLAPAVRTLYGVQKYNIPSLGV